MLDTNQAALVSRAALFSSESLAGPPQSPSAVARPSTFIWELDLDEVYEEELDKRSAKKAKSHHDESARAMAEEEMQPQEFEFRLFNTSNANKIQTILLPKSPSPAPDEEVMLLNFVFTDDEIMAAQNRHRPLEYYFASHQNRKDNEIQQAAIDGKEVLKMGQVRWKGCEVPWRVMHLKVTSITVTKSRKTTKAKHLPIITALNPTLAITDKTKRHRPNKKRRIILRKQVKETPPKNVKKTKKMSGGFSRKETQIRKRTEEEEREKKTRLNRLKKVRRKLKMSEKEKDGQVL